MPASNGVSGDISTNGGHEEPRIGVFICHCGGNISDVVDVEHVAREIGKLPNVVESGTRTFLCSDPGQVRIEKVIQDYNLDRVVVAACSPTLHELTFRRCLQRAGLNPYLYEHCNIREQVSWVVEDKELATAKAIRLVSAAVGRIRHLVPLEKRRIPIHPAALVIGGGVAGMVAARDLSKRGMKVVLLEKSPFLGGRMAQLGRVFPTEERAVDLLFPLMKEIANDPNISVHTGASVIASEGIVGDFRVRVRQEPRGVTPELANAGQAIASCPETTPNEHDFGMTRRKAIYQPFTNAYPPMPAIDWKTCTKCGKCVDAAQNRGISLEQEPEEFEVQAGVIVLATGHDPYEPMPGEFGYGRYPQVVTLQQLYRMLDTDGPTGGELKANGKPVKSIVFVYCVGARQYAGLHQPGPDGRVKDYCARTCCTASLKAATEIKERYPDVAIYKYYQDIRAYGRGHEDYYTKASELGCLFFRYHPQDPPKVEQDPTGEYPLIVSGKDSLTSNLDIEVPADLVVLGTGVVSHDISELVDFFKCAVGYDSFLLEVHPKLRPVELAVNGVFLAGTCQGPMDITEACAGGAAAASKASAMIAQGTIEMDPFIAKVDEDLCTGCQTCLNVCPYDAISRDEEKGIAVVNEALCTGCGTCAATCPSNAIQQFGFNDNQVMSEVMALLGKGKEAVTA